jgi:hypothetical protein
MTTATYLGGFCTFIPLFTHRQPRTIMGGIRKLRATALGFFVRWAQMDTGAIAVPRFAGQLFEARNTPAVAGTGCAPIGMMTSSYAPAYHRVETVRAFAHGE